MNPIPFWPSVSCRHHLQFEKDCVLAEDVWAGLAIAIPTFRRNERLLNHLKTLESQTVKPDMVLVIDNDPEGHARSVVDAYKSPSGVKIEYLSMGRNAGPAGSFAAAVTHLVDHPSKPEWMACRDDDLPFERVDTLARLQSMARNATSAGGVGIWGTHRYPHAHVPEKGPFPVDVIPGGGEPIYNLSALVGAGLNFDESLFFGFEELDIGLRIRRAGLPLLAERLMPPDHVTGERRSADWRTYFGERNWLIIAREFGPFHRFLYYALRALGSSAKRYARGQRGRATATFLGAIDGIRGSKPRPFYIP